MASYMCCTATATGKVTNCPWPLISSFSSDLAPALLPAATRILQALVLDLLFVASYVPMRDCHQLEIFWGVAVLVGVIIIVQLHTYVIYVGILRRTLAASRKGSCRSVACESKLGSHSVPVGNCFSEGSSEGAQLEEGNTRWQHYEV